MYYIENILYVLSTSSCFKNKFLEYLTHSMQFSSHFSFKEALHLNKKVCFHLKIEFILRTCVKSQVGINLSVFKNLLKMKKVCSSLTYSNAQYTYTIKNFLASIAMSADGDFCMS